MPVEGVPLTAADGLLSLEEQQRAIDIFAGLGVRKVRFTGGEPTLNKHLPALVAHASHAMRGAGSVGMTTNGLVLQNQLPQLAAAGLSSVNVSLDTLQPDRFAAITRRDRKGLHKVLASVYAALAVRPERPLAVKINVVLMRGVNDDELAAFAALTRELPVDVRFIELMPFDGNRWSRAAFLGYREALALLEASSSSSSSSASSSSSSSASSSSARWVREPAAQADPHDTTKWYRADGHAGRVGFITSMSDHFCSGCNRLRITADGRLKVCLFGEEGMSLRDAFRAGASDADVVDLLGQAVKKKKAVLGGHGTSDPAELATKHNRPMILIGG
jgi:cyclic pyranopterin phosphate synthase